MGASFVRRFDFDPGNTVLLNIESVNILDLTPPGPIAGVGAGTAMLVAEFENGPYNTPTEVFSGDDVGSIFGTLGYAYAGTVANYPCAIQRFADGALAPEYWNGNGHVHLNAKQFSRLILVRVDTSVGAVSFSRLAHITGAAAFTYSLPNGQILSLSLGLVAPVSATFSSTAATVTAVGGAYPTAFVGGETLTLGYDAQPNFTTTFQAGDTSEAAIIARINQFAGFAFADNNAGQIRLTSRQLGSGAQVRVVSGSAGVTAALGLTVANTAGTGNGANAAAYTFAEVQAVIQTAIAGTSVEIDQNGALRISNTASPLTGSITVGPATTAVSLGFVLGQQGTATGLASLTSGAGTYPDGFVGGETLTLGWDAQPNFVTTFQAGDTTIAAVVSRIQAAAVAAGFPANMTFCDNPNATHLRFTGAAQGGQIRVVGASAGGVLTALGLTTGTGLMYSTQVGTAQAAGVIPAGTRVQNPNSSTLYVTTQDAVVTPGSAGTYVQRIRFAIDDGTGIGTGSGNLTKVTVPVAIASFAVTNLLPTSNALTEGQLDAAYAAALASTVDLSSVAQQANLTWSARQSNTVRSQLRLNAVNASNQGMFGRMSALRTPLGTPKLSAESTTVEPGVGAYRSDRVVFCWPQARTFVPLVAKRGTAGGAAFGDGSGNVDVGADGFLVSVCSQLNPEENPGQETGFTGGVVGLESSPNAQGLTINDYIALKALGICGLRMDHGVAIFQSGVTAFDPNVDSERARISRRRMADFLEDSLSQFATGYGKKLSTNNRRKALAGQFRVFLRGLLSPNSPGSQRIGGFTVDDKSRNTPQLLQQGIFRIRIVVQLLPSLDSIVLEFTVGQNVFDVQEVLPQAA